MPSPIVPPIRYRVVVPDVGEIPCSTLAYARREAVDWSRTGGQDRRISVIREADGDTVAAYQRGRRIYTGEGR